MHATNQSWRSWSFWKPVLIGCGIVSFGISLLPVGGSVMLAILIVLLTILAGGRYSATAPDWMRALSRVAARFGARSWLVGSFWALSCFGAIERDLDQGGQGAGPQEPLMVPTSLPRTDQIPYEVVKTDDLDNAARVKRIHTLLVKPGHSPEEIRSFLTSYQHRLWEKIKDHPAASRGIWIYLYDDRRRAELGTDGWIGCIVNPPDGFEEWPEPRVRVTKGEERPSTQDEALYDYFEEHLYGQGLSNAEVSRALLTKFQISRAQFEQAFLRVWWYRHTES